MLRWKVFDKGNSGRYGKMFLKKVVVLTALFIVTIFSFCFFMFRIPGKSYNGHVPPLTDEQMVLREQLRKDVAKLAGEIGDRNLNTEYENLCKAANFIEESFVEAGYKVSRQGYEVSLYGLEARECHNLGAEITGSERPDEIVVIGGVNVPLAVRSQVVQRLGCTDFLAKAHVRVFRR